MEKIVVTRHPGLVRLIFELGLVPKDTQVFACAWPSLVEGRHVFGILPVRLAAMAAKYTEVQYNVPDNVRKLGINIPYDALRRGMKDPVTYRITKEPYNGTDE